MISIFSEKHFYHILIKKVLVDKIIATKYTALKSPFTEKAYCVYAKISNLILNLKYFQMKIIN